MSCDVHYSSRIAKVDGVIHLRHEYISEKRRDLAFVIGPPASLTQIRPG